MAERHGGEGFRRRRRHQQLAKGRDEAENRKRNPSFMKGGIHSSREKSPLSNNNWGWWDWRCVDVVDRERRIPNLPNPHHHSHFPSNFRIFSDPKQVARGGFGNWAWEFLTNLKRYAMG